MNLFSVIERIWIIWDAQHELHCHDMQRTPCTLREPCHLLNMNRWQKSSDVFLCLQPPPNITEEHNSLKYKGNRVTAKHQRSTAALSPAGAKLRPWLLPLPSLWINYAAHCSIFSVACNLSCHNSLFPSLFLLLFLFCILTASIIGGLNLIKFFPPLSHSLL